MEIEKFLCHSDFTWNQFQSNKKCHFCPTIIVRDCKIVKTAVFELVKSSILISRKIWVKCGNSRIFMILGFYVKSSLAILKLWRTDFYIGSWMYKIQNYEPLNSRLKLVSRKIQSIKTILQFPQCVKCAPNFLDNNWFFNYLEFWISCQNHVK